MSTAPTIATAGPMLAFTSIQIERLTGLSQRQLIYWEESGVYTASYVDERPYRPYRRIYSFRDLVSLRTLALLRNTYHVKPETLRAVGRYLRKYVDSPWSELQFQLGSKRDVIVRDPASGKWISSDPIGQQIITTILVDDIRKEAERDSSELRHRDLEDVGQIVRHRHVAHNRWVIKGTRLTTDTIWEFHEAGYTPDQIKRQYPHVTVDDIVAAIRHERTLREAA